MQAVTSTSFQTFQQDPQAAFNAYQTVLEEREILQNTCDEFKAQMQEMSKLLAQYGEQATTFMAMKHRVAQLERMIFGTKHERFIAPVPGQLTLGIQADEVATCIVTDVKDISYKKITTVVTPKLQHPGRTPLPAHLRREETVLEPFGKTDSWVFIGEERTEQLEYVPGELYVKVFVRPKYSAPAENGVGNTILIADLPAQPIDKCIAGPSLLTQIIIDKYVDAMPLYRQIAAFKRNGVELPQSTFSNWVTKTCELIKPLYDILKAEILSANYLNVDETTMKVMDKDKKGKTHCGWFWVYQHHRQKLVFFDYKPTRGQEAPESILKDFKGYLQVDGYGVYENVAKKQGTTLVCCMAHVRRKFEEAKDNDAKRSAIALTWFQKLYAIEADCKERKLSDEQIRGIRQEQAVPILNELSAWMKQELLSGKVDKSSTTGKAMAYAMTRWDKLTIYTTNGMLQIDNNCVERSIRNVAVGRKNYLFAGSHEAAQRSAMLYSLMGTCKLNDINPYVWLQDVLCRIPITPDKYMEMLLPHNWQPKIPTQVITKKSLAEH